MTCDALLFASSTGAVASVTFFYLGIEGFEINPLAAGDELFVAPLGAGARIGDDEELDVGIGRDVGADVAAVEHGAAGLPGEGALALQKRRPDRRIGGNARRDLRYRLAPQFLIGRVEPQVAARAQRLELVRRVAAPAPQVERDRAVKQAGVHVRQSEMLRQRAGDRPLPACRGAVDRDDEGSFRGRTQPYIPCQAPRFDRGICLWQGAPPNAGQAVRHATFYWS